MTGLDKILEQIEVEASSNADAVIAQAKEQAQEIIAAAKSEGDKRRLEIEKKSEMDVRGSLSRGESAAWLQEKKIILKAKQEIIGDIVEKSKESILNLPDEEYFETILKMVKRHALNQEGEIIFSSKDKERLPKEFEDSIKEALSGKQGASLKISNESRNINGGFLLVYGDVEENCSFDTLFLTAKDTLQDKVNELLFK